MNEEKLRQAVNNRRNTFPEHGIRVPAEVMQNFISTLFLRAGLSDDDAKLMGHILTNNDLRCVFSHGTSACEQYLGLLRDGGINPRPDIQIVHEAPSALVLDGDGGLGYFPCWRGTEQLIAKAKKNGSAVLTTRNHHHFGAAGNYTRLAVDHGCIGLAASNHRNPREPDQPIYSTITSSPLSIGIPTGEQPPLILDMGGSIIGFNEDHFTDDPAAFFKAFGLSNMIQVLGGAVAGIYLEHCVTGPWIANQGAFIAVFDTAHLAGEGEIAMRVDQHVGEARRMQPVPGTDRAELPGGGEWSWERENRREGIPVGDKHRALLERLAAEWDVEAPFGAWEGTAF